MVRRIGEPVMVRVGGGPDGAPGTFLWRDRIYVVREVLGHWQERRSWWAGPAARAVHGDAGPGSGGFSSSGSGGHSSGQVSGQVAEPVQDVLDQEREIWRVEASAGRMFGSGVYDLARDGGDVRGAARSQGWQLLRVAD
jgi:hypothetical protein